ncbi:MAG: hypothetical protein E7286_05285 [Lachnospiraceae bacterium]|nr:hypothetical protein [Lachnospiraceae bacterium]
MDELFDFSLTEMNAAIQKITAKAYQYRESNSAESRRILEEALQKYPDNDILLNNLLYVIDYSKQPDETISIATKLIDRTTHSDVKYDALRFLAYAYKAKGDLDSAKTAIEQIPEIYFTKLTEVAFLLSGTEKYEAAEKQKWISFENLLQMMTKLAEYYEENGKTKESLNEYEKALQLIPILTNDNFAPYTDFFQKQIARLKTS